VRKEDNDWVKKCTEYEVEGASLPGQEVDLRNLGQRLWKKTVTAHGLNREDAMDHSRWTKQIRDD